MTKVGRNDPCPCGSGKKYKKCCEEKVKHKKINAQLLVDGSSHDRSTMQQVSHFSSSFFKTTESTATIHPKEEPKNPVM